MTTHEVFLRRSDVERATGLPRSTIYARMAEGAFPRPVRLSPRSVAWRSSEIAAWQKACVTARDAVSA